jgi:hypothetical protein
LQKRKIEKGSGFARKKARLQIVFYAGQAACSGQTELDVLAAVALGLAGFVAVRLKSITSLLPRAASEVNVWECRAPTHFSRSAILSKRHAYLVVRNVGLRSTFELLAHQKGHPIPPSEILAPRAGATDLWHHIRAILLVDRILTAPPTYLSAGIPR